MTKACSDAHEAVTFHFLAIFHLDPRTCEAHAAILWDLGSHLQGEPLFRLAFDGEEGEVE